MPKKKGPQPLFVARNDERYRLVVMRVLSDDEAKEPVNGHLPPWELRVIDEDDLAELNEGDAFITAYVPESVFGPAPPRS